MVHELRTIITINEEACDGCGLCVKACHEGAIELINGKARLTNEHYCDGLGDCLPACPQDAISFEKRLAPAYDEAAVLAAQQKGESAQSELRSWPIQIKLVSPTAPYFAGSDLLIAADCTAFAYAAFHQDFMAGKITLVGCPKLDAVDYSEKLTQILQANKVRSVTVARMQVPCCSGIEQAARSAIKASAQDIPLKVATISTDGRLLSAP